MIIDVTSHAVDEFVMFSPFYPIGGVPVPFTEGLVAVSVEGIWQGLKVFEDADIDTSFFSKREMKNLKRTTRKYGICLGHRKGVHGEELWATLRLAKRFTCHVTSGYLKTNSRNWSLPSESFLRTNLWYCSTTTLTQMLTIPRKPSRTHH